VGPARPFAGGWFTTGAAIAIAMAAPVSLAAAAGGAQGSVAADAVAATSRAPARAPAGARTAAPPARAQAITFARLPWGSPPAAVRARLTKLGFHRVVSSGVAAGEEQWRGRWLGESATCTPEVRPGHGLVSVTLRFEPGTVGDALRFFGTCRENMARRYGPAVAGLGPGRGVVRERDGARWRRVREGGPVGARMWEGPDGAAAALQLDGRAVVWLRWEAPGWTPEAAPDER
jgi:hypothetical protein